MYMHPHGLLILLFRLWSTMSLHPKYPSRNYGDDGLHEVDRDVEKEEGLLKPKIKI